VPDGLRVAAVDEAVAAENADATLPNSAVISKPTTIVTTTHFERPITLPPAPGTDS